MSPPPPPGRLRSLDALRGLAALYVTLSHARYLLHEGFTEYRSHPETYGIFSKVGVHLLGLFGWGPEAVVFFFVLSGFSIHAKYAREGAALGNQARIHLGEYFLRRGMRLWPPLLLALVATFLLDSWGIRNGWTIYGGHTRYDMVNAMVPQINLDAGTFLGNALFLMNSSVCPIFGSDSPLWSLRYEAWFYLLYPVLWLANHRSRIAAASILTALAAGLSASPLLHASHLPDILWQPLQLMLVWWFGGLLAEVFHGRITIPLKWIVPFAILLVLGLRKPGSGSALLPEPFKAWALGLGFTGILAGCLALHTRLDNRRWMVWLGKTGDFSYTLYVLHMPILVFLCGWLMSRSADGGLPRNPLWALAGTTLCVLVAWLAHFAVEKPFTGGWRRNKGGRP